jgi:hypothetical protein
MNHTLLAAALSLAIAAPALAAEGTTASAPEKPRTAQQQKMKDCNQQAKAQSLKGAARKSFMSSCLKKKKEG